MALGWIQVSNYNAILDVLSSITETEEKDIEVKRNAVKSIGLIFETNDFGSLGTDFGRIWSALTMCLDDYTVDSRGDVGSWIRMAACESLITVFKYTKEENTDDTVGKMLRLSVEKMDRVRSVAGTCLCEIVIHWSNAPEILRKFVARYVSYLH
jgi:hypothetical protein